MASDTIRDSDGHAVTRKTHASPERCYYSAMSELPIACTLDAATLTERSGALLPGLAGRATEVCWLPDGVRLILGFHERLLAEAAAVIAAEHQCCRFLRFGLTVNPGDGAVTLDVTGPEGTVELLEHLLKAES
jgi:hypothetical protein